MLGEERVIVSNVAGTTRDAVDTAFTYNQQEFVIVDTAGMRKKGKVYETTEKYSVLRALKAIDRSDVIVGERRIHSVSSRSGYVAHDNPLFAEHRIDKG